MKMKTAIKAIEELAPGLEASIVKRNGIFHITVLRLAEDAVTGWRESAQSRTLETALRLATEKTKQRLLD